MYRNCIGREPGRERRPGRARRKAGRKGTLPGLYTFEGHPDWIGQEGVGRLRTVDKGRCTTQLSSQRLKASKVTWRHVLP